MGRLLILLVLALLLLPWLVIYLGVFRCSPAAAS